MALAVSPEVLAAATWEVGQVAAEVVVVGIQAREAGGSVGEAASQAGPGTRLSTRQGCCCTRSLYLCSSHRQLRIGKARGPNIRRPLLATSSL